MENRGDECKPCNSGKTPLLLCLLLGVGAGLYDFIGDRLLESHDPWEKAAGDFAKGGSRVIDKVADLYCQ